MTEPTDLRARAAELPEGDVVAVLLDQHDRIREMFRTVADADGEHRQQHFDRLRAFLAVHETAEEMILRPVTARTDAGVADARNREEAESNVVLAELEHLDVASAEFGDRLRAFQEMVVDHAEAEEREELPRILETCDQPMRRVMGKALLAAEAVAPTHPHPSTAGSPAAQWIAGPVASLVDRTRDAIRAVTR
ncbi:hemerythrin domain-containing protein [Nocardioides sp. IC4_145]|uniref:hemerythrin domain-containing protein n=1 Tax=Nocardioides sp. IC4_145 TaxID=2714037 RepID=UPI0014093DA9|nr:hemerythrin domain-containing protein [Nocardioides sp. IC4_145]NHC21803.1 hemerythrin domain-containing protein [Nocardioides sp. IC4_145]